MDDTEFLAHYGVLGMHWGHRKLETSGSRLSPEEKAAQQAETERKKRQKILASPKSLRKNRKMFTQEEVDQAVKEFRLDRDLRQLELSEIKKGSEYANAFLAIGSSAVAAYGIYKSPLGQVVSGAVKKAILT